MAVVAVCYLWFRPRPCMPFHILFNMLQLFFLGREVEARYGTREFYFLYLTMIILGGIVHSLVNLGQSFLLVGASGAVCGIVLLFVLNNPFATLVLLRYRFRCLLGSSRLTGGGKCLGGSLAGERSGRAQTVPRLPLWCI